MTCCIQGQFAQDLGKLEGGRDVPVLAHSGYSFLLIAYSKAVVRK